MITLLVLKKLSNHCVNILSNKNQNSFLLNLYYTVVYKSIYNPDKSIGRLGVTTEEKI